MSKIWKMHICDEGCIVEVIADGKKVSDKIGEIVITDIDNYAMLFIRYKTGDIGTLSSRPCKCVRGLGIFKTLEGRKSENANTPLQVM